MKAEAIGEGMAKALLLHKEKQWSFSTCCWAEREPQGNSPPFLPFSFIVWLVYLIDQTNPMRTQKIRSQFDTVYTMWFPGWMRVESESSGINEMYPRQAISNMAEREATIALCVYHPTMELVTHFS